MDDFDDETLEAELAESKPDLDSFPADLQILVQKDAKIYLKDEQTFANVESVDAVSVSLNLGTKKSPAISRMNINDFKQKLLNDKIVGRSRLAAGVGEDGQMKITPRKGSVSKVLTTPVESGIVITNIEPPNESGVTRALLESNKKIGSELRSKAFIHPAKGLFSLTPKDDYIEIEYNEVVQKHTLELNTVQLAKLKELGIIKE